MRQPRTRSRNDRNVDLVLDEFLSRLVGLEALVDPARYVDFLRGCIEPMSADLEVVRDETAHERDPSTLRFAMLLDVLAADLPPLPLGLSGTVAAYADGLFARRDPLMLDNWASDVGHHAWISSSLPRKARVLSSIIRFCRSRSGLELGTGYGIGSAFLLGSLAANAEDARLTTVEKWQPVHALASEQLRASFGDNIDARLGSVTMIVQQLVDEARRFEFVFHDAMHSGEVFLADFRALLPLLEPGAVVVFDDINRSDARFTAPGLSCHEAWLELTTLREVRVAVEVDSSVGVLLLA